MAKTTWFVAAIAGAMLAACSTTGGGGSADGKFSDDPYICAKGVTPCAITASRVWLFIFPKAAVDRETLKFEAGNPGVVVWTIPDSDFYFENDGITFTSADGGDTAFACSTVSPVDGKSQQYRCALTSGPATGTGEHKYKYTIKIHFRGWYFVWGHDPWMVN